LAAAGLLVVFGLVAVVGAAFDLAVVLGGETSVDVGLDVVDVAIVGGFVIARGVLAVAVADLDGPPQGAR
jgi:hypothetical protein